MSLCHSSLIHVALSLNDHRHRCFPQRLICFCALNRAVSCGPLRARVYVCVCARAPGPPPSSHLNPSTVARLPPSWCCGHTHTRTHTRSLSSVRLALFSVELHLPCLCARACLPQLARFFFFFFSSAFRRNLPHSRWTEASNSAKCGYLEPGE